MDILITGDLSQVTEPLLCKLSATHSVVVASNNLIPSQIGKGITHFLISSNEQGFEKIFNSYNFDVVIFFAKSLYSKDGNASEYLDMANCLKICSEHDVNQFLYIREKLAVLSNEVPENANEALYNACDILCEYYRMRRAISIIVCNTPIIYGYGEKSSVIGDALMQAKSNASIHFEGGCEQAAGYLSQKDMGELLLRMVENWTTAYDEIDVPPSEILKFKELGEILKTEFPTLRFAYKPCSVTAETVFSSREIRREYDWVPITSLSDELDTIVSYKTDEQIIENKNIFEKIRDFISSHSFILKIIELLLGFAVVELLNRVTNTTIQFQYVDFRLLYIVILGTVHGMKTGLGAAALASVSLLASMITNHSNWGAVIYDIDTWLPFIFFFLVGAVTGYIKDKLTNDNKFLASEKELLEEKYVLLNGFYTSALQNKDKYKTQIMSYRNSFGRLFDVTRSLDSTVVDEILNEALKALEDILDNHSVCIYRCSDNVYGRLIICSKEMTNITEKSMRFADYDHMTSQFKDGEVWVNRDRIPGYPEYAMPIFHNNMCIAIITLRKASYEQLAIYYENLIKIVCGLFKISLVRAIEYGDQIQNEMYIPGTKIMNTEYFTEIMRAKEKMAQNGVSEYFVLQFSTTPETRNKIANRIQKIIRANDIIGLGKDNELYLVLSQANKSNIKFVLKRLETIGISFSTNESEEA